MASEPNLERLDSSTLYLVEGRLLKQLAKRAKMEGIDGEIIVQEREGKTFIGFADTVTTPLVVNGEVGYYVVPAQPDSSAGDSDAAKKAFKDALGIGDEYETVQIRGLLQDGDLVTPGVITLLKPKSNPS